MSLKGFFQERAKDGSFLRSVLTVTSGTAISQLVVILVSPLITRLYSPTDMGILASYTAITSVLGTVIAGCYNQAVVLPETKKQTNAVVFLSAIIAAIGCGIITLAAIVFDDSLIDALNLHSIHKAWFYLLGLFVFFMGIDSVLNQYAIRNAHFKLMATTQVTQQIIVNASKILLGAVKTGTFGLFLSTFIGNVVRVIRLFISESAGLFAKEDLPARTDIREAMRRYKKFPLISSWSALLNAASVQLPVLLFTSLFSPAVAGYYSLGHRMLSLPISLISSSVSNVLIEQLSRIKEDEGELKENVYRIARKMMLISAIGMSIVSFHGASLFSFFFGSDWFTAGKYAQWLSIWLLFVFVSSPLTNLFNVLEKQGTFLFINIVIFISRFFSIWLCVGNGKNADDAVIAFSVTGAILWIGISVCIFQSVGIGTLKALKIFVGFPAIVYIFHLILIRMTGWLLYVCNSL